MLPSLLTFVSALGIVAIQVMYIVEAGRRSRNEGIVALLLPPYVWYFAFIRSRQSPYLMLGQAMLVGLFLAAGILRFQTA